MSKELIIRGRFEIEGIPGMDKIVQPLKYLRLRIGLPPPPITVDELSSCEDKQEAGKISGLKRIKESKN